MRYELRDGEMHEYTDEQNAVRDADEAEAARERKRVENEVRWNVALDDGVPYVDPVNPNLKALLRYHYPVDVRLWSTRSYGMPAPDKGFPVALAEPLNGKTVFTINGQQRLDAALVAIGNHVAKANSAWNQANEDMKGLTGGALQSYDIETLGGRTTLNPADPEYHEGWPANTV